MKLRFGIARSDNGGYILFHYDDQGKPQSCTVYPTHNSMMDALNNKIIEDHNSIKVADDAAEGINE